MNVKHKIELATIVADQKERMPAAFRVWYSKSVVGNQEPDELFVKSEIHQTSKILARSFYKEIAIY